MMGSFWGKLLSVDLTAGSWRVLEIPEELGRLYLGGKGLGARLLYDLSPEGADPLAPESPVFYMTGPLTGTIAPSMRGCLVAKSPLTGLFCDTYFGGHFSQEIKYAGYDGIVITGKAEGPVMLVVDDEKVSIEDASHLWGKDTYEVYDLLEKEKNAGFKISCIGPAGENLVRYALVDCQPHRQAGRGGLGAVLGSKNLKAVLVRGTRGVRVKDESAFMEWVGKATKALRDSPSIRELTEGSTVGGNLAFSNDYGYLPTRNFSDGSYEKVDKLMAEHHKERIWLRDFGCAGCPIRCSKLGVIRRGKYQGLYCDNVEYEAVGLLGSNCDISDVETLAYLNNLCDRLGLDNISAGNVLGFCMEAQERGILSPAETDGIEIKFGDAEAMTVLLNKIARREGIGDLLANGVKATAEHLGKGAEEFAAQIKGLETPAWGPRGTVAMGLSYMTADRGGCHMRAFPIQYETGEPWPKGVELTPTSTEHKPELVIWEQNYVAAEFSLVICDMGRFAIPIETYARLLAAATGIDLDVDEFVKTGERVWNMSRLYNLREKGPMREANMPKRFQEPLPSGFCRGHHFTPEMMEALVQEYYRLRGWDEEGKPTASKLQELEIKTERAFRP